MFNSQRPLLMLTSVWRDRDNANSTNACNLSWNLEDTQNHGFGGTSHQTQF